MFQNLSEIENFLSSLMLLKKNNTTSLLTRLIGPICYLQSPDLIMHKSWDAT